MITGREQFTQNKIDGWVARSGYPYAALQELIGEIILATDFLTQRDPSRRFNDAVKAVFGPEMKASSARISRHEMNLYFIAQFIATEDWGLHKACEQVARKTLVEEYNYGDKFLSDHPEAGNVHNLTRKLERDFAADRAKYESSYQEFCAQYVEQQEKEMMALIFTKGIIDTWLIKHEKTLAQRPDMLERYKRS